ncbi:methyl-accepting chemotaxis protein [Brevibacillus borstelensis]|uniref:methyl-accepting chemotaxis protein n=1 Tax=Brevibacillus borstelensis TaxID=45462 RepID=UPI0004F3CE63|nr:methyl-accepting chemotaxis protein [Brevibacillus borstelensis]KKX55332.1 hypothetical protein X546_06460 [Brevibacillus borstelensis cifa_chp40]
MPFLNKLSLGAKMNLLFVAALLLVSAVVLITAQTQLESGIKTAALNKAKSDLALGYGYLDQKIPGAWSVQNGVLYKGETRINDNFELVDELGKLTGGDTVTIFLGDTRVTTNVMKDGQRAVGTKASDVVIQTVLTNGEIYLGEANVVGHRYQSAYQPITDSSGKVIGIWYVGASQELIDSTQKKFMAIFAGALIVVLLIVQAALFLFTRRLKKRFGTITEVLENAGNGDFTRKLSDPSGDEIGRIAVSYNHMSAKLKELLDTVALTSREVAASSENLSSSAAQISEASRQIAEHVSEVAIGSEEQVQKVNNGLLAITEISSNARLIAAQSEKISAAAIHTGAKSEEGDIAIQQAVKQMGNIFHTMNQLSLVVQELGQRSQEIGQITDVITELAGQTNLLSLNAAIEAARAGEHGRGFAVVADEVRKLAEQSARSAEQIEQLIVSIQAEAEQAVQTMASGSAEVAEGIETVNNAGASFAEIRQSILSLTEMIREVSGRAQNMSSTTESVLDAVSGIAEIASLSAKKTQAVSAASEEQTAAMQEVTASALTLAELSEQLKVLVNRFRT